MRLGINSNLIEQCQLAQRAKQLAREYRSEVDHLFGFVVKRHRKLIVVNNPKTADTMNRMLHHGSLQWRDRQRRLPIL